MVHTLPQRFPPNGNSEESATTGDRKAISLLREQMLSQPLPQAREQPLPTYGTLTTSADQLARYGGNPQMSGHHGMNPQRLHRSSSQRELTLTSLQTVHFHANADETAQEQAKGQRLQGVS